MAITVRIPTPLQKLTGNRAEVPAQASTIQELIVNLEQQYPGIKGRLCDEQGKLRRFVNVYVNEEDIRFLKQEGTALKDGDEVSIIPAIAGGASGVMETPWLGVIHPAPLDAPQRGASSLRDSRLLSR